MRATVSRYHISGDEARDLLAMAALIGKVEDFDSKKEEWSQYEQRLEHFFLANEIEDAAKQRSILITVIGPGTLKVLRSLVHPAKPGEKTYAELLAALRAHFAPPPSMIVQRFKFHTRVRRPGETVAQYVSELRAIAEFCKFGDGRQAALEEMLRDRLVCGIGDERIQAKLMAEDDDLTYKKAMSIAQSMEAAAKNIKELQKPDGSGSERQSVNKMHHESTSTKVTGYRCGQEGHLATKCHYKDTVCHNCGKKGHLKVVCRKAKTSGDKKPTDKKPPGKPPSGKPTKKVNFLEEDEVIEEDMDYPLHLVKSSGHAPGRFESHHHGAGHWSCVLPNDGEDIPGAMAGQDHISKSSETNCLLR